MLHSTDAKLQLNTLGSARPLQILTQLIPLGVTGCNHPVDQSCPSRRASHGLARYTTCACKSIRTGQSLTRQYDKPEATPHSQPSTWRMQIAEVHKRRFYHTNRCSALLGNAIMPCWTRVDRCRIEQTGAICNLCKPAVHPASADCEFCG